MILEDRGDEIVLKPGVVVELQLYGDEQISRWDGSDEEILETVWMPGGSMGHSAAAIEVTWILQVVESSVPTTATFFPANSLDLSWSLNR